MYDYSTHMYAGYELAQQKSIWTVIQLPALVAGRAPIGPETRTACYRRGHHEHGDACPLAPTPVIFLRGRKQNEMRLKGESGWGCYVTLVVGVNDALRRLPRVCRGTVCVREHGG